MKTYRILLILIVFISLISCKCKNATSNFGSTEILTPTYKMYDLSGERGYTVNFRLKDQNNTPTAVVINGIKKKISPDEKNGNSYNINVIAQSERIMNFKTETSELANGIIFKTKSGEIHQPVNFVLIK